MWLKNDSLFHKIKIIKLKYLILYIASLALGGLGALLIVRWGSTLRLLDRANHRSSHKGVIPKGGGIGILATFLLVSWVLGLPVFFWMCLAVISLLSFYGDSRDLSPKVRLGIQLIGSVVLLLGLFYWEGRGWSVYFLIPFFAVFVAGTANYYNFMDGINGIAGITGIISFWMIALFVSLSKGHDSFIIFNICMGLACLGFLPFNMPKARVFMGDVGSVMLGFVYAVLVVGLSYSLNDFIVLCSFLFPFYADELTTLYVRLRGMELPEEGEGRTEKSGQRLDDGGKKCRVVRWKMKTRMLAKPHREHLYQLLANEMGIEHWKISLGYGVLQILVGIGVLMLRGYGNLVIVFFLGFVFAGFAVASCFVRRIVNRTQRDKDEHWVESYMETNEK